MDQFNPIWLVVVGLFAIAAVVYLMLRKKNAAPVVVKPPERTDPVTVPRESPPAVFIDRDDLMLWIGTSKFTHAVTLDGQTVHGGFGPPLAYVSGEGTPNKNIKRS